ncbi:MAG TPA: zinc-ribbon domain-containing protein [Tepidisphaeraceae bacterium]|jgi:tetratricopeptide (TPR) repeat protein|nr:zinc-ribbon domain-containing protein [Tepidisphaeraceae bacterium]
MRKQRRTRRGFIIFFGWRTITSQRPEAPVNTVCPSCRQETSIVPMQGRDWFTLFFIPVFPISGAKPFVKCTACQTCFDVDIEQFRRKASMPDERAWQQCIALYNTLRESPKDSVLLNRLLEMYAAMREFEEALAAGRHFPDALNGSAQCLTTYGKVHLASGNAAEALKYFQMALQKNKALGEAHFYTAVAYLSSTPPNPDAAITSARLAATNGYPNTAEFIRQAESVRAGQAVR